MNRKGVVGMGISKKILLAVAIMGILGFVTLIVLQSLTDTSVAATTGSSNVINETLTTVTENGEDFAFSDLEDALCTNTLVTNFTGVVLDAGNYTSTNCNLATTALAAGHNNSDWLVTYSYTWNRIAAVNANISGGVEDFFSNAGTWFALLAIVIIILIVVIVMKSVNGIGGSKDGGL